MINENDRSTIFRRYEKRYMTQYGPSANEIDYGWRKNLKIYCSGRESWETIYTQDRTYFPAS